MKVNLVYFYFVKYIMQVVESKINRAMAEKQKLG